jgi:hypothetical protein
MRGYPDRPGTLLGAFVQRATPELLFEHLAVLSDAAIIDSRPLLTEDGRLPPAQDRFASDLMDPDRIEDPRWREFTQASMESGIPLILGGHNLVSGGLYLLGELCWQGRSLPRRLPSEPFEITEEPHERR